MANKQILTLGQVVQLPPGTDDNPTWVDDFKAIVTVGQSKQGKTGKTYWPVGLTDTESGATLTINMYERPLDSWNGAVCRFSGGMRMCSYNGRPDLKLGKKTLIAPMVQSEPSAFPTAPKSIAPSYQPTKQTYQEMSLSPAPSYKPQGQTVGMAINQACEFLRHQNQPFSQKAVYLMAKEIIAVSAELEAAIYEKTKPAAKVSSNPVPARVEAPSVSQENPDEDVPF
jgi:hypothetical protein